MKVRTNRIDIIIEVLCLVMTVGITLYLILSWSAIPDLLPTHYTMAGEVDGWGPKGHLWLLTGIMWFTYILMAVIERFPKTWNTGVKVTPHNCGRVYRTVRYMLNTLKLLCVGLFGILILFSSAGNELPLWFTIVYIVIIVTDTAFWGIRLIRISR